MATRKTPGSTPRRGRAAGTPMSADTAVAGTPAVAETVVQSTPAEVEAAPRVASVTRLASPAAKPEETGVVAVLPPLGIVAAEDVQAFGKDTVDALTRASTAYAYGMEDMVRAVSAQVQASLEDGLRAGKAIIAAKTLKEMTDLQHDFARRQMDAMIDSHGRLTAMALKIAADAWAPVRARMGFGAAS